MMISVIVPIYNIERYIGRCIESIIGQSYTDLEIILVDDGSVDGSGRICDRYAKEDSRIRVIHKENGGLVSARKAGLLAAKGAYVSYVDGDDWIDTDTYEKLLDMGKGADVIAFSAYEEFEGSEGYEGYGEGQDRKIKRNTVEEGLYLTGEDMGKDIYSRMMVDGDFYVSGVLPYLWAKLIRRDILLQCQMRVTDSITYAEDVACTYPCLLKAGSIYISNMPFYHYRVRPDSMVRAEAEVDKMAPLFWLLGDCFMAHPMRGALRYQLQCFMWHTMLLKGYGQIEDPMPLFPFEKVEDGMRVAVYGAGMFGRVIWNGCKTGGHVIEAGWFDQRYAVYSGQGLCVRPADQVMDEDFDMLVIAILNARLARQIREDLIQKGIDGDKIDHMSMEALARMRLPAYMEDILAGGLHARSDSDRASAPGGSAGLA